MKIDSPFWNLKLGVCEKHHLPQVPCPACMAGVGDEDVEFTFSEAEKDQAELDYVSLRDLVPANFKKPNIRQRKEKMNMTEWAGLKQERQFALDKFRAEHREVFDEYDDLVCRLAKLRAENNALLQEREVLAEQAGAAAPEGHVRCQAIHHGGYICDEIAERRHMPPGWVMSLVGELCFCLAHAEHVREINRTTLEAPLVLKR